MELSGYWPRRISTEKAIMGRKLLQIVAFLSCDGPEDPNLMLQKVI